MVAKGKGAITLSPSNIIDNKMDYSSCTYISWAKYEESPEIMIHNNDILLVKTGSSYGKSAFVEDLPEKATINPQFVVLKETRINPQFLCYFLQSNYAKVNFDKLVVGTAIPTFSQANLNAMYIAFPGINEQKRIVNKILELLKYIDTINDEKKCLQSVILQTKSKILDLAIHGKLVPQDPNDEPASVLLERIRAEKEELIKQGKIKRNKKESVIFKGDDNSYYEKINGEVSCIDDEIPYELPYGWLWMRLENCCIKEIRRGKSPKYIEKSNILVFAQKCNTKHCGINISLAKYIDEATLKRYPSDEYMQDGDVVINSTGTGTLGRVGFYRSSDNNTGLSIVPDSHVTIIRGFKCIQSFYLYTFMKANQSEFEKKGEGSTNQKELKPITLKDMFIAIPPLSEQKRMEEAISITFNHLSTIKKNIS